MKKFLLKNIYFLYTVTFLLLLPFVFLPFLTEGKSFVWQLDGLDQHFPALVYYGKLLRGLLAGKGFPMVDFTIGLGFDTLTTLSYYVIGDPISLLSVFMTAKNAVFLYDFLILLRLYLAGISFILLMKSVHKEGLGVILGAVIYVFSGYCLFAGLRHPFFLNPMIYLPLIIIGVEKVLKGKKPYLMIAMIFISALSNFYFFYALSIITVIYIIFRYCAVYRKDYKNFFSGLLLVGLKTGGYYLLGTALASFLFIPVLYAFTRNGRLGISPGMVSGSYLHYTWSYYLDLPQSFFTSGMSAGYWSVLSFSAVTAASTAVLLCNKKFRQLQLIYLLAILGLCIPAFGYFMNGFSYVSNRWCFAVSLLTAVTFSFTYDRLLLLDKKEKLVLCIELALMGSFAFIYPSYHIVKYAFVILLIASGFIFLLQVKWFRDMKRLSNIMLYVLVFVSLGFNGYSMYSKQYYNYTSEFLSKKEVINQTIKGPQMLTRDIHDNSFFRVETHGDKAINESLILGYKGVSGYFSLMDGDITSFMKNLEILSQHTAFRFHNLDGRAILGTLTGVKYYVTDNKAAVPYGYIYRKEMNFGANQYYLFENSYALPLGYTYNSYLLRADYDRLSALEKQNALQDCVVLDKDTDYAAQSNDDFTAGITKLNATVTTDANVMIGNHTIDVKKPGGTITLSFNSKPNSETYVRLGKFNITQKKEVMTDIYATGDTGLTKKINIRSAYYNSYFGKENYLINLGYSPNGQSKAVITFPDVMTYNYDSIEVYSVDMSDYANRMISLNKAPLTGIKLADNRIRGEVTLDSKGILTLDIPFSRGWNASVDGKKADLLKANVMYMALPLDAGTHRILLKYETPYLRFGFFISLAAFFLLLGIIIYNRKRINE